MCQYAQIAQQTVAANSLAEPLNQIDSAFVSIGRLDTCTSTILQLETLIHFAKRCKGFRSTNVFDIFACILSKFAHSGTGYGLRFYPSMWIVNDFALDQQAELYIYYVKNIIIIDVLLLCPFVIVDSLVLSETINLPISNIRIVVCLFILPFIYIIGWVGNDCPLLFDQS